MRGDRPGPGCWPRCCSPTRASTERAAELATPLSGALRSTTTGRPLASSGSPVVKPPLRLLPPSTAPAVDRLAAASAPARRDLLQIRPAPRPRGRAADGVVGASRPHAARIWRGRPRRGGRLPHRPRPGRRLRPPPRGPRPPAAQGHRRRLAAVRRPRRRRLAAPHVRARPALLQVVEQRGDQPGDSEDDGRHRLTGGAQADRGQGVQHELDLHRNEREPDLPRATNVPHTTRPLPSPEAVTTPTAPRRSTPECQLVHIALSGKGVRVPPQPRMSSAGAAPWVPLCSMSQLREAHHHVSPDACGCVTRRYNTREMPLFITEVGHQTLRGQVDSKPSPRTPSREVCDKVLHRRTWRLGPRLRALVLPGRQQRGITRPQVGASSRSPRSPELRPRGVALTG